MNAASPSAASVAAAEWRAGWRAVAVAAVGIGTTSIYYFTLGLMIAPLHTAFGWSAAQITAAPAIISVTFLLLSSRAGALADRVGVYRLTVPGFVAFCLVFAALGLAGPALWSWYALWLVLALAYCTTAPSHWSAAIATRFDRSRALALSMALGATGITGFVAPLVAAWAIGHGGWRSVFPVLGGGLLVVGGSILWLALRGQRAAAAAHTAGDRPSPPGKTFAEALRDRRFWMLALAAVLVGAGASALVVHLVPICMERGLTRIQAAELASLIGVAAIVGRLAIGVLMDWLGERVVGAFVFLIPVAVCLLLTVSGTGALAAAAVLIGLATGAEFSILTVVVSRYFGMRAYAAIAGQVAAAFNVGIGFAPSLAGLLHDGLGGYVPFLRVLAAILLVPPAMLLLLGRVPSFAAPATPAEPATLP